MSFLTPYTVGMSTARWMELPARLMPVFALTPTQRVAPEVWPQRCPMPAACADPCIHVVQLGTVFWVEDGHHRLARARLAHEEAIMARVLKCVA